MDLRRVTQQSKNPQDPQSQGLKPRKPRKPADRTTDASPRSTQVKGTTTTSSSRRAAQSNQSRASQPTTSNSQPAPGQSRGLTTRPTQAQAGISREERPPPPRNRRDIDPCSCDVRLFVYSRCQCVQLDYATSYFCGGHWASNNERLPCAQARRTEVAVEGFCGMHEGQAEA